MQVCLSQGSRAIALALIGWAEEEKRGPGTGEQGMIAAFDTLILRVQACCMMGWAVAVLLLKSLFYVKTPFVSHTFATISIK